jgi:hypothetical protein
VRRMRLFLVTVVAVVASAAYVAPASAQPQQNGLINLAVTDVNVQVPVAVAANLCDINVNVLAAQERLGGAECEATADSLAVGGPRNNQPDPGGTQQDGLVNVFIDDVNVQVPIAVAANVCDVNVNVLALQLREGGAQCDADADADATRNRGANA